MTQAEPCGPCESEADRGQWAHDAQRDIWYECIWDERAGRHTWAIIPATD